MIRLFSLGMAAVVLAACATSTPVSTGPTPADITASGDANGEVHWGGQIVKVKNLADRTLVEVLALPLDGDGRPLVDQRQQGRFIVDKQGYLEPHDYAPDRLIEVRGLLKGFTDGRVGDAPYRYPVVVSERIKLWEAAQSSYSGPRISP
ncbi:MAG: Slp family lipoprotein, partial [Gammaproteobacteria bacterium]|nr:Slp family lipoprotein [Gammaproteobacteria bacterium]